jgi:Acyl-CoA dehydrogenase, C-terminal domain
MIEGDERALFARGVAHATATLTGTALDGALASLGWREALLADPRTAVSVMFECQGAANARSSALDVLLTSVLGVPEAPPTAMVLPLPSRWEAPGRTSGARFGGQGLATAYLEQCDRVLLVAATDGGHRSVVVERGLLALKSIEGLDPEAQLLEVTIEGPAVGAGSPDLVDWSGAVSFAHRALGHELVGSARAMVSMAREHALERVQFGRPISSFQAVRHRLAESVVAIEAADALLSAAWDEPTPENSAIAKAFAGRSAKSVARHCQQVLAGIGFTTEHTFHRYLRRSILLDQLFGGSTLTAALGSEVLGSKELPAAAAL